MQGWLDLLKPFYPYPHLPVLEVLYVLSPSLLLISLICPRHDCMHPRPHFSRHDCMHPIPCALCFDYCMHPIPCVAVWLTVKKLAPPGTLTVPSSPLGGSGAQLKLTRIKDKPLSHSHVPVLCCPIIYFVTPRSHHTPLSLPLLNSTLLHSTVYFYTVYSILYTLY